MLVNDQLNQLYIEMELEGLSSKLTLEEGITSSSSSGEETISHIPKVRQLFNISLFFLRFINVRILLTDIIWFQAKKKRRSYSSLMMIYEENAPFPSPTNWSIS